MEIAPLFCQIESHAKEKLIAFCIDENCTEKNKFICSECIFDVHPQHKLMKIKDVFDMVNDEKKSFKIMEENMKKMFDFSAKEEEKIKGQIEKFKSKINEVLTEKTGEIMSKIHEKIEDINKNRNRLYYLLEEFNGVFKGNAAPVERPNLVKISEICEKIRKNSVENKLDEDYDFSKDKEKIEEICMGLNTFLESKINIMTKLINESLNYNLNNGLNNFEWSKKTYGKYGFLYELSEQNLKALKTQQNGTMTVLRSEHKLENNKKYKITYKIGYDFGDDFDVGIGTEDTGKNCWLRGGCAICVSNKGVFNNGALFDSAVQIKNGDFVSLEVATCSGKTYFKAFINDKAICNVFFDFLGVYFMAAIRNVGNYIEVISYSEDHI